MAARIESDWLINAALLSVGALVLTSVARRPTRTRRRMRTVGAYLTDHRAGAAAALTLLAWLRHEHAGTALGHFLDELDRDIQDDRQTLDRLIAQLRVPSQPLKKAAGRAGGVGARLAARMRAGDDLVLLEALESLALGVQGKRCLWRALIAARIADDLTDPPDFTALERRAVDQSERIERHRLAAARTAMATPTRPGRASGRTSWTSILASATAKLPTKSEKSDRRTLRSIPDRRPQRTPPDVRANNRSMI